MTTTHACMWPGCTVKVLRIHWGCAPHWFRLPREIRAKIVQTYRYGQSIATASPEWRAAVDEAEAWIHTHAGEGAPIVPRSRRAEAPPTVAVAREGAIISAMRVCGVCGASRVAGVVECPMCAREGRQ